MNRKEHAYWETTTKQRNMDTASITYLKKHCTSGQRTSSKHLVPGITSFLEEASIVQCDVNG
uniref:Uncharacterized protein n=1 Tax=Rhizophora mucronata TaxID=61149 RepID=A0A2P2L051_RHIMU